MKMQPSEKIKTKRISTKSDMHKRPTADKSPEMAKPPEPNVRKVVGSVKRVPIPQSSPSSISSPTSSRTYRAPKQSNANSKIKIHNDASGIKLDRTSTRTIINSNATLKKPQISSRMEELAKPNKHANSKQPVIVLKSPPNRVLDTKTNVTITSPVSARKLTSFQKSSQENQGPKRSTSYQKSSQELQSPRRGKTVISSVKTRSQTEPIPKKGRLRSETRVLETRPNPNHLRTHTRNLDVNEIRYLQKEKVEFEPVHAVVQQVVKPDAATSQIIDPTDDTSESFDYEDDFETYESDFESDDSSESQISLHQTSDHADDSKVSSLTDKTDDSDQKSVQKVVNVEEERKLDSGNYDLRQRQIVTNALSHIKENSKEFTDLVIKEGHVETNQKLLETVNHEKPLFKSVNVAHKNASYSFMEQINKNLVKQQDFIDLSHIKTLRKKVTQRNVLNRGREILEKLKLDVIHSCVLDISPLTYNEFMNTFGKTNNVQAYSQTKDDNLTLEIQTDDISVINTWTQQPVCYMKRKTDADADVYETLCTGHDSINKNIYPSIINTDNTQVNEFLEYASKEMLLYLNETSKPKLRHNKNDIALSDGYYKFNNSLDLLANMNVIKVLYSEKIKTLMSVHVKNPKQQSLSYNKSIANSELLGIDEPVPQFGYSSIICLWYFSNQSEPNKILATWSEVSAVCFSGVKDEIVIAGMKDGSVACWDCTEGFHHHVLKDGFYYRSPSYFVTDYSNYLQGSVVAVKPLLSNNSKQNASNFQLCSLHEYGKLTTWTIIKTDIIQNILNADQGGSYWSCVRLVNTQTVQLQTKAIKQDGFSKVINQETESLHCYSGDANQQVESLQCSCLEIDNADGRNVFVVLKDLNYVISTSLGLKSQARFYNVKNDIATNIATCPYQKPWFVVSCSQSVQLFTREVLHPLVVIPLQMNLVMSNNTPDMIQRYNKVLQWSHTNPFYVYVCDVEGISVIDLKRTKRISYSQFEGNIYDLRMFKKDGKEYMAVAATNGLQVHKINKNYRSKNDNQTLDHLLSLSAFVNVL